MLAALGTAIAWFTRKVGSRRRAYAWLLLLWLPVPFYTWSVAYGSVPIFFPAWWPYTWYNTRYGLELLPALALGLGFAAQLIVDRPRGLNLLRLAPRFPSLLRIQQILPKSSSLHSLRSPASMQLRSCAKVLSSMLRARKTSTHVCGMTAPFLPSCSTCSRVFRTRPC